MHGNIELPVNILTLTFRIETLHMHGSNSPVVWLAYILQWNSSTWSHRIQWFFRSHLCVYVRESVHQLLTTCLQSHVRESDTTRLNEACMAYYITALIFSLFVNDMDKDCWNSCLPSTSTTKIPSWYLRIAASILEPQLDKQDSCNVGTIEQIL